MAQTLRSPTRFTHGLAQMFEVAIDKDEFPNPPGPARRRSNDGPNDTKGRAL